MLDDTAFGPTVGFPMLLLQYGEHEYNGVRPSALFLFKALLVTPNNHSLVTRLPASRVILEKTIFVPSSVSGNKADESCET